MPDPVRLDASSALPGVMSRPSNLFLDSPRATAVCAKEFTRLSDDIIYKVSAPADVDGAQYKPDVRQSPGRCIVQLGPVALTVSWVHAQVDTVTNGRLMVIEWLGTVARGPVVLPERVAAVLGGKTAVIVREDVYLAEGSTEQTWRWRQEAEPRDGFECGDLAAHCAASLWAALARVMEPVAGA